MKRLLALVFVSASVAGCVSAPSTTPSQTALKADALGLSAAPAPAISSKWWEAFGDKQLDGLVEQAQAGNPSLAATLARMRMAEAELAGSRAQTYPQLTLDGQEQREHFSNNYIIPPPYAGTTQWIGTVQANLSWSIDFWGRQSAMVDKARSSAEAATLDAAAARLALAGSVTQAYIALSRAYVLCDLAEATVKQREGVLALTNTRVKNGLESTAPQKLAQALLATAREDLIGANSNRDLAEHEVAALVGRGADLYGQIARPRLDDGALGLPQALPADLLARRPDIAAAQARIAAAMSGRDVARTAFYPDVNLAAFAGWAAIGLGPMFGSSALTYGAGPAIHLPIFDAGKLRADYAGATAALDASVDDYNEAVVTAVKQTADTLSQLRSLQDQAVEQREALAAAEASFQLAQTRYRNGLNPQLNVLDAENTLLQARLRQAALDADIATSRVALLLAVGGDFDSTAKPSADAAPTHQDVIP